jgi:dTMP kinase
VLLQLGGRKTTEGLKMKVERGRLIVFEGVDATGKTTLCNALYESLSHENNIVRICHFPGTQRGTLGELVYRIHHSHSSEFGVRAVDPCSIQLLHIAAHVDAIESEIKPALRHGEWVILDRFWWSTYIYGLDNGVQASQLRLMINVEKIAWGTTKPDLIFLVDSGNPLRIDEINTSAWQRKRHAYNRLAAREGNIEKCVRLETGEGDNAKYRALYQIQESIASLER